MILLIAIFDTSLLKRKKFGNLQVIRSSYLKYILRFLIEVALKAELYYLEFGPVWLYTNTAAFWLHFQGTYGCVQLFRFNAF